MDYKCEAFVTKISCPIICVVEGEIMEFSNGAEMYEKSFDKNYQIDELTIESGKVKLTMKERQQTGPWNWIGEEAI
jgi:hypothetical protein